MNDCYYKKGADMKRGFTLIELMIVVAIIGFLAMISVPTFTRFLAKAKRAEAFMNLSSIYAAQKAHWAENGTYTDVLYGEKGLGWKPEGDHYYTYGFAGSEGRNYFSGKVGNSGNLSRGNAGKNSFIAVATADIMGSGYPDILTVDESNRITIVQDGLAK
jgi:prepilin-type N-terminal cleavage/methylation domain